MDQKRNAEWMRACGVKNRFKLEAWRGWKGVLELDMTTLIDFGDELRRLEALECWGVVAGEGQDARVRLHFGKKKERGRALENPALTDVLRRFEGEFELAVQNCAWRLDGDEMICSSKSPNHNEGSMVRGLRLLVGQRVTRVTMTPPVHDLVVEFSGGSRLRLFCDCFDLEEDGDNYSFHSDRGVSVVRAGGMLVFESRR
jgi:hypothetical protein